MMVIFGFKNWLDVVHYSKKFDCLPTIIFTLTLLILSHTGKQTSSPSAACDCGWVKNLMQLPQS